MLRPNLAVALMVSIPLLVCLMALLVGCGKGTPPAPPKETAAPGEEATPKPAAPFQQDGGSGVVEKTVDKVAGAAKDEVTKLSAEKLGNLHISGLSLLLLTVAARFLFGSWRQALFIPATGITISAGAVLLTDYPRVVLLIPLAWVVVLIAEFIRKAVEWHRKAKGFDATANVIEAADTGPLSAGQLIKNKVVEAGYANVVDVALKPLEKIWKQFNQQQQQQQQKQEPQPAGTQSPS